MIQLPTDFKDFLKLLNENDVEYLLVGGYAVSYYGYPRATADIDILVATSEDNAEKMVSVLKKFGFDVPSLSANLFMEKDRIIRLGHPPLRIELLTSISGVGFAQCYERRNVDELDGIRINIIGLPELKANKQASGRHKDLDDLEHLP